jgi:hypothetical protein
MVVMGAVYYLKYGERRLKNTLIVDMGHSKRFAATD